MTVTLNPLYRFDTFVVGSANRLAVTAAKAVAARWYRGAFDRWRRLTEECAGRAKSAA